MCSVKVSPKLDWGPCKKDEIWYICFICQRAYREAEKLKEHKVQEHLSYYVLEKTNKRKRKGREKDRAIFLKEQQEIPISIPITTKIEERAGEIEYNEILNSSTTTNLPIFGENANLISINNCNSPLSMTNDEHTGEKDEIEDDDEMQTLSLNTKRRSNTLMPFTTARSNLNRLIIKSSNSSRAVYRDGCQDKQISNVGKTAALKVIQKYRDHRSCKSTNYGGEIVRNWDYESKDNNFESFSRIVRPEQRIVYNFRTAPNTPNPSIVPCVSNTQNTQDAQDIETKSIVPRFKCRYCGKICPSNSHLIVHTRCHTKEKPYKCNFFGCTYAGASTSNLYSHHKRVHGHENIYRDMRRRTTAISANNNYRQMMTVQSDSISTISYPEPTTYTNRAQRVTIRGSNNRNNRRSLLSTSSSLSSSSRNLPRGSSRYQRNQTHSCSTCGKMFKYNCHLLIHERTHTPIKPYKCPWLGCTHSTKSENGLQIHLRRHTGERPMVCSLCFESFAYRIQLKRHEKAVHNHQ